MRQDIETILGSWTAGLSPDGMSDSVRRTAVRCMTDCVGVALAGTGSEAYRRARSSLTGPAGSCSALGQSLRATPADAAFLNAVAAHAYDFDDTCFAGIAHASAVVLPAALAAAQHEGGRRGEDLLVSFVAGIETACRLGLAFTDALYYRGHWNTGLLGVAGAAAAVSRMLGLSPAQTTHALRLAINFPLGLRAIMGSNSKPYLCGAAARTGLECAYAARAGIQGQPHTLEGSMGFVPVINQGILERAALRGPDAPYCIEDPGVAFKLFPICSAGQAGAEALLALRAAPGVEAGQVESITCLVTELVNISLRYPRPDSLAQAQFSMPFAIASCLVYGELGISQLEEGAYRRPEITRLMEKVSMIQDDALVPPAQRLHCPEATRVILRLRGGEVLEHTVLAACGMPRNPAAPERLRRKFHDCAAPVLGESRARQLFEALDHLPGTGALEPVIRMGEAAS